MTEFYTWAGQLINRIDTLIFTQLKTKYIYGLSLAYILIVYRLGLVPFNGPFTVSQNPFINAFKDIPSAHYNYDSIVAPLIAYFAGLNASLFTYFLFNLAIILIANLSFIYLLQRTWNQDAAKILILLFVLNPISAVLFTWVGSYDSVSYLIQSCLFLVSNPIIILALGFVGGMNHFPIILVSGLSLFLFRFLNPEDKLGKLHIFSLLLGLVLGSMTLEFYQDYYELSLSLNRVGFISKILIQDVGLKSHVGRSLLLNWSTILFSFYNVLWAIAIVLAYYWKREQKKLFYVFIGSNFCFFALTLLVFDSTRVFCLLSWPTLFYGFLFLAQQMQLKSAQAYLSLRRYFIIITLVGLLVPRLYVWEGRIFFAGWISSFEPIYHSF